MSEGATEQLELLARVAATMATLGIEYFVCGSLASSIYGLPRSTVDIDLLASIPPDKIRDFVNEFGSEYYIEEISVRNAVSMNRSFNAIHLETLNKFDFFTASGKEFEKSQFARRRAIKILPESDVLVWFASPEDTILSKLIWYVRGNRLSTRQLEDAIGVLRVQGSRIDQTYLRTWAAKLRVEEALDEVLRRMNEDTD